MSKTTKILILVGVLIAVLGLLAGGYLLYTKKILEIDWQTFTITLFSASIPLKMIYQRINTPRNKEEMIKYWNKFKSPEPIIKDEKLKQEKEKLETEKLKLEVELLKKA